VTLAVFLVGILAAILAGARWGDAPLTPQLALDLEGGTQIILTPIAEDGAEVTDDTIAQAIEIIRQRVDASGVAEAEISSQGGQNIVVALPGQPSQATLNLVRESAQMLFRPVLAVSGPVPTETVEDVEGEAAEGDAAEGEATEGDAAEGDATEGDAAEGDAAEGDTAEESPAAGADEQGPAPTDASDPAWITEELQREFNQRDCTDPANLTGGSQLVGDPSSAVVACDANGFSKYILGPVEVRGQDVDTALSTQRVGPTGAITNEWIVTLEFNRQGTQEFREVTTRLVGLEPPRNQFAMVLDGLVISAPAVNSAITNGNAEISGSFTRESAGTLARQLNFGALPLTFEVQSEETISATLGSEQLQRGILAGVIGLLLVALYSLLQYRALGLLTIGSLVVAGVAAYLLITFLSWTYGYRLSLAGVAGLIVSIGITADSFIVYFERIKDELRDGRSLTTAVEEAWQQARRTILASDAISLLAAVVLYMLAVGGVRGFAFTLGLMTLIDLLVVFLFTHPVMTLLARTNFFGQGHRLSGLDATLLRSRSRYVGRGRVVAEGESADRRPAGDADPAGAGGDGEPVAVPAGGGSTRMTIAERRAAERRAARASGDAGTEGKDA
jgi:preprotein translocase subunit SecD